MFSNSASRSSRFAAMLLTTAGFLAGCEGSKEKVIDVKAPGTSVEVTKDNASGKVDVDVNVNKNP